MATRRSREPQPSSGIPAYVPAIGVLLIAAVAAIWILSNVDRSGGDEAPVEKVNPFEGLPEDVPPGTSSASSSRGSSSSTSSSSSSASPFEDIPSAREDAGWLAAVELAERGATLRQEAAEAKDAGDQSTFKAKGAEAKEAFSKALEDTQAFEDELGEKLGYDHRDVKAVVRARSRWLKDLVTLKKTVGL